MVRLSTTVFKLWTKTDIIGVICQISQAPTEGMVPQWMATYFVEDSTTQDNTYTQNITAFTMKWALFKILRTF